MCKNPGKFLSPFLSFLILATLISCAPSTPITQNDKWEITILSSKEIFRWNNVERFAGAPLIVLELKFHRLDSPTETSISLKLNSMTKISSSLNDIMLTGYEGRLMRLLGLNKSDDTIMKINGSDMSEVGFLFCSSESLGASGCSYSTSMSNGGLPDASNLARIDAALVELSPEISLAASGDTLYVTLAFDNEGGKEDLIFQFTDLPAITFSVK